MHGSGELFSYVDLETREPAKHPLRLVRRVVNDVLAVLDGDLRDQIRRLPAAAPGLQPLINHRGFLARPFVSP